MDKLEAFDIKNTNINLPLSLKWISRNETVGEELIFHENNLLVWWESHLEITKEKPIESHEKFP